MFELQIPNYIEFISKELTFKESQIKTVLDLTLEWATVPFIARYRKELTWNLDENNIRDIIELNKNLSIKKVILKELVENITINMKNITGFVTLFNSLKTELNYLFK